MTESVVDCLESIKVYEQKPTAGRRISVMGLKQLTPTEKAIFNLYLDGKTAAEIMEIMTIKQTTLKYHNRNIYSKLGVSSKKQPLNYAALYARKK